MRRQYLPVQPICLLRIAPLQVNRRQLNQQIRRGLPARLLLNPQRPLQQSLRNLKLVRLLVHRAQHRQESRIRQRCLVHIRRHPFHLGNRRLVVAQLVLRAHQPHPRRQVARIVVQHLRKQIRRLVKPPRLHQDARILHPGPVLQIRPVVGERQRQRLRQRSLRIRRPAGLQIHLR